MNSHIENLGRAARILKRLHDIGGPAELEGVPWQDVIDDVLLAQRKAIEADLLFRLELPDNVVPIDRWSVGA